LGKQFFINRIPSETDRKGGGSLSSHPWVGSKGYLPQKKENEGVIKSSSKKLRILQCHGGGEEKEDSSEGGGGRLEERKREKIEVAGDLAQEGGNVLFLSGAGQVKAFNQ